METLPHAGFVLRYNFTVEESTPIDIEVAVDPEMLGKLFEELVTGGDRCPRRKPVWAMNSSRHEVAQASSLCRVLRQETQAGCLCYAAPFTSPIPCLRSRTIWS